MATQVDSSAAVADPQRAFMSDQGFFVRYAAVLAIFIMFGFLQFAMRGYSDFGNAPFIVHLHGGLMVTWLAIFIVQNLLIHRGELGLHRKFGWTSAGLVLIIGATGVAVGYHAVATHRLPPFFSDPFFLALTSVGSLTFAGMVVWAITLRRQVQWHRRVMLGAMFILLEPALGRLLPLPLMGAWGEWSILAVQLIFVAVLANHDRKVLGAVHSATKVAAGILVASHVLFEGLAVFPPFVSFAQAVAAG